MLKPSPEMVQEELADGGITTREQIIKGKNYAKSGADVAVREVVLDMLDVINDPENVHGRAVFGKCHTRLRAHPDEYLATNILGRVITMPLDDLMRRQISLIRKARNEILTPTHITAGHSVHRGDFLGLRFFEFEMDGKAGEEFFSLRRVEPSPRDKRLRNALKAVLPNAAPVSDDDDLVVWDELRPENSKPILTPRFISNEVYLKRLIAMPAAECLETPTLSSTAAALRKEFLRMLSQTACRRMGLFEKPI